MPKFRVEDQDGGVSAAVDGLLEIIAGTAPPAENVPAPKAAPKTRLTPGETVALVIGGILFLAFCITHPRFAFGLLRLLFIIASAAAAGEAGGGGGFSGGGGRSGGGGASGGW